LDSLRLVLPIGHTDGINSAVFSSDGKVILTAGDNWTARINDVLSGKELMVFRGHTAKVKHALFSPDSKLVLTLSEDEFGVDNSVRIWEARTGKPLCTLSSHEGIINTAFFSSEGNFVLTSGADGTARIYKVSNGEELLVLRGHEGNVNSAVFSVDGELALTSGSDATARLYKISTGEELKVLKGHEGSVNSGVFSPDGKYALTASWDKTARLWDLRTGKEVYVLKGHKDWLKSAAFSSCGLKILTTSDDGTARLWSTKSGRELRRLRDIDFAEFSFDSKLVLTLSENEFSVDNSVRIWDANSGKVVFLLGDNKGYISAASFSPNSKLVLLSFNDGESSIHNVENGRLISRFVSYSIAPNHAEFSSNNSSFLVAMDDSVSRIYDLASGKELRDFRGHKGAVSFASFCHDGNRIISSSWEDNTARVFDVESAKQILQFSEENGSLSKANFSPDGSLVITCEDSMAKIYNAFTGEVIQILHASEYEISSAEISMDCRLAIVASSWDAAARIFDISDAKELIVLEGHEDDIRCAAYCSNGEIAVTTSGGIMKLDKTARIWDVETGKVLQILSGHNDNVNSATFDTKCSNVLTASDDATARIWDVATGKLIRVLIGHEQGLNSAEFSFDGKLIISTSCDNKVIVWESISGNPIFERIQLIGNNWLVKLPNSPYYMCSKDASKMLHYVTPSLKVIGFDQLDPIYNRPDVVLDSISKYLSSVDEEIIKSYHLAWEKRVDKLGLKKELLATGEIAVPNAEIANAEQIEYENKDGKVILHIKANDPKYTLQRYNVLVNEVPVYGSAVISIAGLNTKTWERTDTITLGKGRNKIQVSVMNELGLENFKYPTYVNYTPMGELASKTVFIGIGVNHFKESVRDLKYCVKDVQDLANEFASNQTLVDTLLLTDQEVTRENVLALRAYLLKNTTENDKVIISCSSHGLLDDSLNFFLAMHDVDFKNPKGRGLKYEELESLLDGIPARQKLLLLDACNSGENDKTELLKRELSSMEQASTPNAELIAQIGTVKGVLMEIEEENQTNFRKMNELFVNVRNNTGSVIISAAGGQQSALEAIEVDGHIIENGAFTFSVLEYLKQREGDKIKVTELKQYAEKRVEEITEGKQKPTSRQETMEVDWVVR